MQKGDLEVNSLLIQGDRCLYRPKKKIEFYIAAAEMCEMHGLYQREAIIYCKLSCINLNSINSPQEALDHAEKAILADPTYGNVS